MRLVLIVIAALVLLPPVVRAAESLPWAYPLSAPGTVPSQPDPAVHHVPGSTMGYTQAQIEDNFNAVDWFPTEHPPMPGVVEHGSSPIVWACAKCHLANGLGHPESASLAGLPAAYIARQIAAYKDGSRTGGYAAMARIAKGLTDDQTQQAAAWFSTLTTHPWIRVVETANVPKTYVGDGNMRAVAPGNETEPIGERIIEVPENVTLTTLRDPHSGTIAYVPRGSIERGKLLVTTGGGETTTCATCHGATLNGVADTPSISGRSPTYIFRQVHDIQSGTRNGPNVALMQGVVANLSTGDMIAISAYLASLQP
jgi:cytochrome c553